MATYSRSIKSIPLKEPRAFPTTGFVIIPQNQKLDEENWPWYNPESFYPVNIGDVLSLRYQVLFKVGFGTTSTVWICRDLIEDKYVCMKSLVWDYASLDQELDAYRRLAEAKTSPLGGEGLVRKILDHFQVHHGGHDFHFLIHEALGPTLHDVLDFGGGRYPFNSIKWLIGCLIYGVEFLHHANVIHGDLNTRNIMYELGSVDVLSRVEEQEISTPSPRKMIGDYTIFCTRRLKGLITELLSEESKPILCDLGEARSGQNFYKEHAQPTPYRAPEIFLSLSWGKPIDIWNIGCMIWHCVTGTQLFPRKVEEEGDVKADGIQIATMVALLGPPPKTLLDRAGKRSLDFFKEDGSPRYEAPTESLESRFALSYEDTPDPPAEDESAAFLAFIRRVLIWDDKERPTAGELTLDPWFE